jgi:hypothetical protein
MKGEFERAIAKYPDISPFVILKLSLLRRGVVLTSRALEEVQKSTYNFGSMEPFLIDFEGRTAEKSMPGPILLRDSTNVFINYGEAFTEPYIIEWFPDDGVFSIFDGDLEIDHVDFVPRPKFFGEKTSRGTPMEAVAAVRARRMTFTAYRHCHYWDTGDQCKFCAFFTSGHRQAKSASMQRDAQLREMNTDDIYETVRAALRENGRFSMIGLTGGTDYGGKELFDDEVDRYIRCLQAIGRNFNGRFTSQLMAPAYTKKQLRRIYDETGLTSYSPNIEIWDEEISKWLCPGKHRWPGHSEWIRRTVDAVEIFGKGNVSTQVVAGAEMAQPYGFQTVSEALKSNFEACEFYAKNGVVFLSMIWHPHRACRLGKREMAPLDYYIELVKGLHAIRKSYGLRAGDEDYKHCGNHPDSDLERLD